MKMRKNTVVVGLQWGDEGKGKIIDVLVRDADVVVRYGGGSNAGHTVIVRGQKYVLHLVPSGILHRSKLCVIGNGVVVDPVGLVAEVEGLRKAGVRVDRNLVVSETAHVVLPYHKELDGLREAAKGAGKLGTTRRGIGPAYADKAERSGLRMVDLLDPVVLSEKLEARLSEVNTRIRELNGRPVDIGEVLNAYTAAAEYLRPFVRNSVILLHELWRRGKNILFEGAQGSFLDIDHGTYPYVTSSNTTVGGALTGTGLPPQAVGLVVGVMKAYTTRVGEGPLPTEASEISDLLHGLGREFGSTTGRPRRCGWFDAVVSRQAAMINGVGRLAITNVDGLDTVDRIRVCVGYRLNGKVIRYVPSDVRKLALCEPVYEEFPGWKTAIGGARRWRDLPAAARRYLGAIAELTGARPGIVSVGPDRNQTIMV